MKIMLLFLAFTTATQASFEYKGVLSKEDQKYYKNDSNQGMNQLERTDSLVREINRLHGDIASMKSEIAELKKEVEKLKQGK